MTEKEFAARVLVELPYRANDQQVAVVAALARFCAPGSTVGDRVFVLNGYAGTGKTSLTSALVRTLASVGVKSVLLAPTGRAAKVFTGFSGHPAHTVHRRIYRHSSMEAAGGFSREVLANSAKDTVFIVDEASMIGSGDERGTNLLADLIHFVYTGENCRLVLLGDTAQLPPVGCEGSPAMDAPTLRRMGLKVTMATLTAPARQERGSGILHNATWLRRAMQAVQPPVPQITTEGFTDIATVAGDDVAERLDSAYSTDGVGETVIITRSNRTARDYNAAIRANVLYIEEKLQRDELLIVAKNNYYWTRKTPGIEFIANGDIVAVSRVIGTETRYGLEFADVELTLPDSAADTVIPAKIMLDTLLTDTAGLTQEFYERLYYGVIQDPEFFPSDMPFDKRVTKLRDNPYWCALQVKYAYAMTCHKAQGGQWKNVFVDLSYVPPEAMGKEFYRWLYTAVTRARKKLFLINLPLNN